MQMLAVDGVEQGVVERLDQYLAFLQVPTQPPQSTATPPPPPTEEELPPPPPLEKLPPPSPQEPPPRKAAKTSTKEIHIDQDGEKYGPYNLEKVNDFLEQGRISSTAMAWKKGLSDWIPITEIDGVVAPKDEGPPPSPSKISTPNDPPPKRKLQSGNDTGEKIYYDKNEILVTSNRFVCPDADTGTPVTYAMKNMTSVRGQEYVIAAEAGFFRGCAVWLGIGAFSAFCFYFAEKERESLILGIAVGLVGAAIYGLFFEEQDQDTYYYCVENITASGNQQSYTSYDRQEVDEIVAALNESIINSQKQLVLHLPLAAVIAREPLGIAALGKRVLLGIPRNGLLIIVGLI